MSADLVALCRAAGARLKTLAESRRACMAGPSDATCAAVVRDRAEAVAALFALRDALAATVEHELYYHLVVRARRVIEAAAEEIADDLGLAGRLLRLAAAIEYRARLDERPTDPDLAPEAEGPRSSDRRLILPPPPLPETSRGD